MNKLNISGIIPQTLTNGEGLRTVIFFQGCTHNCKGCHNKSLQEIDLDSKLEIDSVLESIISNSMFISGVTLSGGEPFQQDWESLLKLIVHIKDQTNLDFWIYTGYNLEELYKIANKENKIDVLENILRNISTLVEGRFVESILDTEPKSYRGSTNQKITKTKNIESIK